MVCKGVAGYGFIRLVHFSLYFLNNHRKVSSVKSMECGLLLK